MGAGGGRVWKGDEDEGWIGVRGRKAFAWPLLRLQAPQSNLNRGPGKKRRRSGGEEGEEYGTPCFVAGCRFRRIKSIEGV